MTYRVQQNDIVVRPLAADDTSSLYRAVRSSVASLSYWLPWCHADYSLADAEKWVAHCLASWEQQSEFPLGVFNVAGELLGGTGLTHVDRGHNLANIGYWVGDAHRGRGVATVAARLAAQLGFDALGFTRLEIVVLPQNHASQRVAEKLGAMREAEARNRVLFQGRPATAIVYSLVPGDIAASGSSFKPDPVRGPD